MGGKHNLLLPQEEETFFPLPEEIWLEFHYALLDGKHIGDSLFKGRLIKLSAKGALVRAEREDGHAVPQPLSNIKLTLLRPRNSVEDNRDIYARFGQSGGTGKFLHPFHRQTYRYRNLARSSLPQSKDAFRWGKWPGF
jgi:hypothetical protein